MSDAFLRCSPLPVFWPASSARHQHPLLPGDLTTGAAGGWLLRSAG